MGHQVDALESGDPSLVPWMQHGKGYIGLEPPEQEQTTNGSATSSASSKKQPFTGKSTLLRSEASSLAIEPN
jgi:hypothetical protein